MAFADLELPYIPFHPQGLLKHRGLSTDRRDAAVSLLAEVVPPILLLLLQYLGQLTKTQRVLIQSSNSTNVVQARIPMCPKLTP